MLRKINPVITGINTEWADYKKKKKKLMTKNI